MNDKRALIRVKDVFDKDGNSKLRMVEKLVKRY